MKIYEMIQNEISDSMRAGPILKNYTLSKHRSSYSINTRLEFLIDDYLSNNCSHENFFDKLEKIIPLNLETVPDTVLVLAREVSHYKANKPTTNRALNAKLDFLQGYDFFISRNKHPNLVNHSKQYLVKSAMADNPIANYLLGYINESEDYYNRAAKLGFARAVEVLKNENINESHECRITAANRGSIRQCRKFLDCFSQIKAKYDDSDYINYALVCVEDGDTDALFMLAKKLLEIAKTHTLEVEKCDQSILAQIQCLPAYFLELYKNSTYREEVMADLAAMFEQGIVFNKNLAKASFALRIYKDTKNEKYTTSDLYRLKSFVENSGLDADVSTPSETVNFDYLMVRYQYLCAYLKSKTEFDSSIASFSFQAYQEFNAYFINLSTESKETIFLKLISDEKPVEISKFINIFDDVELVNRMINKINTTFKSLSNMQDLTEEERIIVFTKQSSYPENLVNAIYNGYLKSFPQSKISIESLKSSFSHAYTEGKKLYGNDNKDASNFFEKAKIEYGNLLLNSLFSCSIEASKKLINRTEKLTVGKYSR